MKMFIITATLLFLPFSVAAENFLCIPDKVIGFEQKSGWATVSFQPNSKYIVRPPPRKLMYLILVK